MNNISKVIIIIAISAVVGLVTSVVTINIYMNSSVVNEKANAKLQPNINAVKPEDKAADNQSKHQAQPLTQSVPIPVEQQAGQPLEAQINRSNNAEVYNLPIEQALAKADKLISEKQPQLNVVSEVVSELSRLYKTSNLSVEQNARLKLAIKDLKILTATIKEKNVSGNGKGKTVIKPQ